MTYIFLHGLEKWQYLVLYGKIRLENVNIYGKRITPIMILYYNKPESADEQTNIFIDFASIHHKVKNRYSESSLYRLLRKKKIQTFRYQNRDLYQYEDIMNISDIYKDLKRDE